MPRNIVRKGDEPVANVDLGPGLGRGPGRERGYQPQGKRGLVELYGNRELEVPCRTSRSISAIDQKLIYIQRVVCHFLKKTCLVQIM